jgi:hypothetical protein
MNIIEALNKLKENSNIAIKCGDITYMKQDRMGVLYKRIKKNKFHRIHENIKKCIENQ